MKFTWAVLSALIGTSSARATQSQAIDVARASQAIRVFNDNWYNSATGLWDNAWWQSACALTTIADFVRLQPGAGPSIMFTNHVDNTFGQAQKTSSPRRRAFQTVRRGYQEFINRFYDDEGHWALALLSAYDAMRDERYLNAAVDLFQDMQTGRGTPCNGGIFWSKDRTYVNAVANELYMAVAASLARHIPSNSTYLATAKTQWQWFQNSGMINDDFLINDGLTDKCANNRLTTWSYNQGIVLGGLTDLFRVTDDLEYLFYAHRIARAAMSKLADDDGILEEADKCELKQGHCGFDGKTFKGIFIRNLRYLYEAWPQADFRRFILKNADSIWRNARDPKTGKFGVAWQGPFVASAGPSHSSAMDALVAAVAVV